MKVKSSVASLTIVLMFVASLVMVAHAYNYKSTNAANKAAGNRHFVEVVSVGEGYVELRFVNQAPSAVGCFEYRTDGDTSQATGPHPLDPYPALGWDEGPRYAAYCLAGGGTRTEKITANGYVEIRSTFGAERDWDFAWTRFDVIPVHQSSALADVMPYRFTNPAFFGAPLEIFHVAPNGNRTSVWSGNVGAYGDVSLLLRKSTYLASSGYGTYGTNDPANPVVEAAARYLAVVNGDQVVQDVIIGACTYCLPTSYIISVDTANQEQRHSTVWYSAQAQ